MRSARTSSDAASSAAPVPSTTAGRRSSTSGAAAATRRRANRGRRTPWPRPLHNEGHLRHGDGGRPLARAPRLRRARQYLLAGVRPEWQGVDHRPAVVRAPSRAVRARRATDEQPPRRSRPAGRGTRTAEAKLAARHAASLSRDHLGFYQSEIMRRVDPRHRTLGQFFQDEIATPLGLDFYIRLPEAIPDSRLAPLHRPRRMAEMFLTMPTRLVLAGMNPRSRFRRALQGSELPEQSDRVYARNQEVPSGGGVGTARALARAYGVFASGGKELGLREETLRGAHGTRSRTCSRVPRRVHACGDPAFAGLREARASTSVCPSERLRTCGNRGIFRLRRSPCADRFWVRSEPDGHPPRRPEAGRAGLATYRSIDVAGPYYS